MISDQLLTDFILYILWYPKKWYLSIKTIRYIPTDLVSCLKDICWTDMQY